MAEGRLDYLDELMWNHTASVIAKVHNLNCTKTSQLKTPMDFHPYAKAKQPPDLSQMSPEERAKIREMMRG